MSTRWRWNEPIWKRTQSVILWCLGAAGVANELFIEPRPRPEAWPIIGILVGLPFAQAFDAARRKDDPKPQGNGEARP